MVSLYYSLMIPVILCLIVTHHVTDSLRDGKFVLILSIYFILFGLILFFVKQYTIQIFLFLLSIITGVYGFHEFAYQEYPIQNAIYSTLRLYVFDIDNVFHKGADEFVSYPFSIEVARWSAALYSISTLFYILYLFLENAIRLFFVRLVGNHYVLVGYNLYSRTLIHHLREDGERVIIIMEQVSDSDREYLLDLGVIVLVGSREDRIYKRAGIETAKHLILMNDDSKNLNELVSVAEFLRAFDRKSLLQVSIMLTSRQSYLLYEDIEQKLFTQVDVKAPFLTKIVNPHRLIAEKLLEEYPLYQHYETQLRDEYGEPLHLLFLGFDETNQQIALEAMERGHFLTRKKLQITILDENPNKLQNYWFRYYPNSSKVADFHFKEFDLLVDHLTNWIEQSQDRYTHVFISHEDDLNSLLEGINLSKKIKEIPIYINVQDYGLISYHIDSNTADFSHVHCFGYLDDVLNKNYFINEDLDAFAKLYHQNYQKSRGLNTSWEKLNHFTKESNRSQAKHAYTKLMLLELTSDSRDESGLKRKTDPMTEEEFLQYVSQRLEPLAEIEHRRWNAFHYLRGWNQLENPTKDMLKVPELKQHACLVSWEELDELSNLAEIDYKQYDRESYLNLYKLFHAFGKKIYRDVDYEKKKV